LALFFPQNTVSINKQFLYSTVFIERIFTGEHVMRFALSIMVATVCVAFSGVSFAQEKITIRELPASSALAQTSSLKSGAESGAYASTSKKRVSPETEKQYLKAHPEAAFILPADTQDRIKAGLPVQVIRVDADNLTATGTTKK
jgi:hypothetical protein